MTVKELIEKLEEFDQNLLVCTVPGCGYSDTYPISSENIRQSIYQSDQGHIDPWYGSPVLII